jgi:hypothetical protein
LAGQRAALCCAILLGSRHGIPSVAAC